MSAPSPRSLVFVSENAKCDICATKKSDGIMVLSSLDHTIGWKVCEQEACENAVKEYQNRYNILGKKRWEKIFQRFGCKPSKVIVQRSSGVLDDGWELNEYIYPSEFSIDEDFSATNDPMIPVKKENMEKNVKLSKLIQWNPNLV